MENVAITLELTIEEINTVLASLGKHPFESIAVLIQKIQTQGSAQVAAYQEAQAVATEDTDSDAG